MTVGSLFAGIGGFDLGLERAGMTIKWQVEIDPFCRAVLAKHWPDVRRYEDVRTVGAELERVDLICGGDPCQENSRARRVHERTLAPSLGHEFIRVVAACRPRLVLRENPSRVRSDAPWPWWRFRSELERLGYMVLPFRLRTCCFGADGERDRLFMLAQRSDTLRPRLEGWKECGPRDTALLEEQGGWTREPVPEVGSVEVWIHAGAFGVREGLRFSGGVDRHRIRGVGNSVAPAVAEWIGRRILEAERLAA
jgi:DNA (cytosine-5)-methyltransferase 1